MNPMLARLLKLIIESQQSQDRRLVALEEEESRESTDDVGLLQEIESLLGQLENSTPSGDDFGGIPPMPTDIV
jgi:hypothetical protein